METNNNTVVDTISTINEIYGVIKTSQFVGEEVYILRDVKKIDYQLENFNYIKSGKEYTNLVDKYYSKLSEMGYFKYTEKSNRTPAEKIKHNLRVVRMWLIRLIALNACDEVVQNTLKGKLKSLISKYASDEAGEYTEAIGNILSEFDINLLDKLKVSKVVNAVI